MLWFRAQLLPVKCPLLPGNPPLLWALRYIWSLVGMRSRELFSLSFRDHFSDFWLKKKITDPSCHQLLNQHWQIELNQRKSFKWPYLRFAVCTILWGVHDVFDFHFDPVEKGHGLQRGTNLVIGNVFFHHRFLLDLPVCSGVSLVHQKSVAVWGQLQDCNSDHSFGFLLSFDLIDIIGDTWKSHHG